MVVVKQEPQSSIILIWASMPVSLTLNTILEDCQSVVGRRRSRYKDEKVMDDRGREGRREEWETDGRDGSGKGIRGKPTVSQQNPPSVKSTKSRGKPKPQTRNIYFSGGAPVKIQDSNSE